MRSLVACSIVSLDGFSAGPGGDVLALPFDDGFNDYALERLRAADTLLNGRTTHEEFHGYWPAVADDPDAPEIQREISRRHNAVRHIVVSDSLAVATDSPWSTSTDVVPRAHAHEAAQKLLDQDGDDVLIFGSRTVWNHLLAAGLLSELHLLVGPTLLGDGVSVFTGEAAQLQLIEARQLNESSLVLHRYAARSA